MDQNLMRLPRIFDIADEFQRNISIAHGATVVPNLIAIGGTFLFHWGFVSAIIFNAILWLPQLGIVMLPLYKHRKKIIIQPSEPVEGNTSALIGSEG